MRKIAIQAVVGGVLFAFISVILEGDYVQAVWLEKGMRGLAFAVLYGLFLVVKTRFIKK